MSFTTEKSNTAFYFDCEEIKYTSVKKRNFIFSVHFRFSYFMSELRIQSQREFKAFYEVEIVIRIFNLVVTFCHDL